MNMADEIVSIIVPQRKYDQVLQQAIDQNVIVFPEHVETHFEPVQVYRAVSMQKNQPVRPLNRSDFNSQVENVRIGKPIPCDERNWVNYSCSCFVDLQELSLAMKLPRKSKRIAIGRIDEQYGSCLKDIETTHIHWFLYEDCDPSPLFYVEE